MNYEQYAHEAPTDPTAWMIDPELAEQEQLTIAVTMQSINYIEVGTA